MPCSALVCLVVSAREADLVSPGTFRAIQGLVGPTHPVTGQLAGTQFRDTERGLDDQAESSAFAPIFASAQAIASGHRFCAEVERRFGVDALDSIFTQDGRFPTAAEIDDPVAWAARVLLSDIDPT